MAAVELERSDDWEEMMAQAEIKKKAKFSEFSIIVCFIY